MTRGVLGGWDTPPVGKPTFILARLLVASLGSRRRRSRILYLNRFEPDFSLAGHQLTQ